MSSGKIWTGLTNPSTVLCSISSTCSGSLKWVDGSSFEYQPFMSQGRDYSISNSSSCLRALTDPTRTEISDYPCSADNLDGTYIACQFICPNCKKPSFANSNCQVDLIPLSTFLFQTLRALQILLLPSNPIRVLSQGGTQCKPSKYRVV